MRLIRIYIIIIIIIITEYVVSKNLRILVDSFAARGFGLRPTPKIPAAREKNLWYPG